MMPFGHMYLLVKRVPGPLSSMEDVRSRLRTGFWDACRSYVQAIEHGFSVADLRGKRADRASARLATGARRS